MWTQNIKKMENQKCNFFMWTKKNKNLWIQKYFYILEKCKKSVALILHFFLHFRNMWKKCDFDFALNFEPLPPSKHQLQRKTEKNDFRQAKITFSSPCPLPSTSFKERRRKMIFGQRKSLFRAPAPSSRGRRRKMIFGQRKSLFQAPAPSKHPLQRNTEKNDFRPAKITFPSPCPCPFLWSEISNPSVFQPALEFTVPDCPSQFLARIIVCSSHEASKSGHMLGIYVNLIVFFFLIVLRGNRTKGRTNTKCQYPPFLHNLTCWLTC